VWWGGGKDLPAERKNRDLGKKKGAVTSGEGGIEFAATGWGGAEAAREVLFWCNRNRLSPSRRRNSEKQICEVKKGDIYYMGEGVWTFGHPPMKIKQKSRFEERKKDRQEISDA